MSLIKANKIASTIMFLLLLIGIQSSSFGQDFGLKLDLNKGAVYGNNCGFAGSQPVLRVSIEEHITANNLEAINEWLQSGSEVRQVYAAEALVRLANEGLMLMPEQKSTINQLKESTTEINTCYGCIYGPQQIKEILVRFNLK